MRIRAAIVLAATIAAVTLSGILVATAEAAPSHQQVTITASAAPDDTPWG